MEKGLHRQATQVLIDGVEVDWVQAIKFEHSIDKFPKVTLTILNPEIELDGFFTKDVLYYTVAHESDLTPEQLEAEKKLRVEQIVETGDLADGV